MGRSECWEIVRRKTRYISTRPPSLQDGYQGEEKDERWSTKNKIQQRLRLLAEIPLRDRLCHAVWIEFWVLSSNCRDLLRALKRKGERAFHVSYWLTHSLNLSRDTDPRGMLEPWTANPISTSQLCKFPYFGLNLQNQENIYSEINTLYRSFILSLIRSLEVIIRAHPTLVFNQIWFSRLFTRYRVCCMKQRVFCWFYWCLKTWKVFYKSEQP